MNTTWTPDSWRAAPIRQVPAYPDQAALQAMEARLGKYPPLVFAGEARSLKAQLKQAGRVNARYTLIIGEDELAHQQGILRNMATQEQQPCDLSGTCKQQGMRLCEILARERATLRIR